MIQVLWLIQTSNSNIIDNTIAATKDELNFQRHHFETFKTTTANPNHNPHSGGRLPGVGWRPRNPSFAMEDLKLLQWKI